MEIVGFPSLGSMGELGNQLFQVAVTLGYAEDNRKVAKFPPWQCRISGSSYMGIFRYPVDQTLNNSHVLDSRLLSYNELKHVELPSYTGNVMLQGYFQSEQYFSRHDDIIRKAFQPTNHINGIVDSRMALVPEGNRVAVHVRTAKRSRNDYDVHASCTREYLEAAFSQHDPDSVFVIFADNMEVALEILPEGYTVHLVEGQTNYVDLFMMTRFNKYILSPSTFGWWGAWLSQDPDPDVTIMREWFNPNKEKAYLNDNDITPKRWKQL